MNLTIEDVETGETLEVERIEYFEIRDPGIYVERDGEAETFHGYRIGAGSDLD